jgi:hypothetical protein
MTHDEIIALAREAGCSASMDNKSFQFWDFSLERYTALVEQATLEKAAQKLMGMNDIVSHEFFSDAAKDIRSMK